MNLADELKSLDINDVGRWPFVFRMAVIALIFAAVCALGIWFTIVKDRNPQLQRAEAEEQELKLTFENKQRKAVNYDAYKAQLDQIEQHFGTMLRQLPGETEIPSLIVDISQTGLAAGLQENLFRPEAEIPREFYAEKPIVFACRAATTRLPTSSAESPLCRVSLRCTTSTSRAKMTTVLTT